MWEGTWLLYLAGAVLLFLLVLGAFFSRPHLFPGPGVVDPLGDPQAPGGGAPPGAGKVTSSHP